MPPAEATTTHHVVEIGAGRPIVLIHDLFATNEAWQDVVDVLARDWRCVVVDLPGHGESAPVEPGATIEDLVGDLSDVLDDFGALPASFVGHGIGGAIAGRIQAERPDAVMRLIHVASDPIHVNSGLVGQVDLDPDDLFPQLFALSYFQRYPGAALVARRRFDAADATGSVALARLFRDSDERQPPVASAPTLVIAGHDDEILDVRQLERAAEFYGAEFVDIAGSGHSVPLEESTALAAAINHFLEA